LITFVILLVLLITFTIVFLWFITFVILLVLLMTFAIVFLWFITLVILLVKKDNGKDDQQNQ
jgi:uncharacterized Tic20 family protein